MPWANDDAVRSKQSNSGDLLIKLLKQDLPPAQWTIDDFYSTNDLLAGELDGQINRGRDADAECEALVKRWATHLNVSPTWDPDRRGGHLYAVGAIDGVKVRVWAAFNQPPKRCYPATKPEDR